MIMTLPTNLHVAPAPFCATLNRPRLDLDRFALNLVSFCTLISVMQVGFAMLEVGSISPKNTKVRYVKETGCECAVSVAGHVKSKTQLPMRAIFCCQNVAFMAASRWLMRRCVYVIASQWFQLVCE